MGLNSYARDHNLIVFFVIAYAFSWLIFLPIVVGRAPIELIVMASFGPSIAALATHRLAAGNYRAFRIYATWPRTLGASVIGICLVLVAYVVLPGITTADPRKLHWSILVSASVYNYSTLLGGPIGEEGGWRGYALPRLEAQWGPVRASLILGLLWAGWHLPLFFVRGWSSSPPWVYVLTVAGLSVIMSYGTNLSKFAVIPAILTHAAFNTVSLFLNGLFGDIEPSAKIPFELVLGLSGLAVALLLTVATRGRLGYQAQSPGDGL